VLSVVDPFLPPTLPGFSIELPGPSGETSLSDYLREQLMKIGFIDYKLNNYHANKFHGILNKPGFPGNVQIVAAYEQNPEGEDWCAAKGVARAQSSAEVVEKSDAIIVLGPDNTDTHPTLAAEALRSGKPTLIDKSLADTLANAQAMLAVASQHNTPVMSASSLRFSVELEEMLKALGGQKVDGVFSRGFGKWRGYAVHTISPAIRLLGSRIKRVVDTGSNETRLVTLEDVDGRRAFVELRKSENQMEATPWQIGALAGEKYHVATIAKYDEFYENLMKQAVEFFRTGKSPVLPEEQLDTLAVELAADESQAAGGSWIDLKV